MDKSWKERVDELGKQINELKVDDDGLHGYKLSPFLKEMIALADSVNSDDKDTAEYLYRVYYYVGDVYTVIGRFSLAALYKQKSLEIAKICKEQFKVKCPGVQELVFQLLRDRNYYVDDDCEDVIELAKDLVADIKLEEMLEDRKRGRRSLKHDPVEMSEEYLAVIDEVEEKIEKNRTFKGMGSCHEIWGLKFQYLLEKGIRWKSPQILNPRVMFD